MEMCNARAVPGENRYASPVFRWRDEEVSRLVCQIFGGDPKDMAAAARRIEDEGFFAVDINMGCSVAGICKKNYGAALLRDPDLAVRIVERVREAVSIPVMVKFRTGWQPDPGPAADLAARLESAGVDGLVFHPRVAPDRRSRPPKWEHIRVIRERVSIPVLGNGNVFSGEDCARMLAETGCDGVAIGRMAVARPWIFAEIASGQPLTDPPYRHTAEFMARALFEQFPSTTAVKMYKKFMIYFAANFVYGHQLYSRLTRGTTLKDMQAAIEAHLDPLPQVATTPNGLMMTA
jgi:tRNA-dihydrouridine synthase